jgi:Tol biopolymer transport system component
MKRAAVIALTLASLAASHVTVRRICEGPPGMILGGPSPDGRFLSCVDPETGDLAALELETARHRRLTRKTAGSGEFAYFSVVSPDSRRVACAWFNEAKFYDLRVVDVDGGEPRVLYRNEEAGFVQPSAWTPDGKHILTLFFRKDNTSQIALVSAADGSVRILKSLPWVYPKKMDFSPDGRFIVYDNFGKGGSQERDIYLLAADGSRESTLVEHPANDLFPVYAPDGRRVLFASDRNGTMDLWMVAVEDGAPRGAPVLVRRDLGRFLPMGVTRRGVLYYGVRSGATDVYVASFDAGAGRILGQPVLVSRRVPGGNSAPEWSSDGRQLAWLSRRGSENFGTEARVISIRSIETGEERDLAPRLAHIERLRFAPDGRALLASGSDRRSLGGLYRVDAATGEVTPVLQDEAASFRGLEDRWASTTGVLLYARGAEIRRPGTDGREETTLFSAPPGTRISHLALDPQGRRLAFVSGAAGRAEALEVVPAAGGPTRRLFDLSGCCATGLEWMPDGSRILLTVAGDEKPELWRVPLEGGPSERISLPADWRGGLRVHPDGRRVAFTAGQTRSEVWVMEDFLP